MHFLHMAWLNFKGQRAAFNLEEFLLLEMRFCFALIYASFLLEVAFVQSMHMEEFVPLWLGRLPK